MAVSGAAFSTGGGTWFERQIGAGPSATPVKASGGAISIRSGWARSWIGPVSCVRTAMCRRRTSSSPQAIPRTAKAPDRSEPMGKETV